MLQMERTRASAESRMDLRPGLILLLCNVDGERKELVESSRTQTDDGNGVKLTELRAIEEVQHNIMAVVRSGLKKHEVNGCN